MQQITLILEHLNACLLESGSASQPRELQKRRIQRPESGLPPAPTPREHAMSTLRTTVSILLNPEAPGKRRESKRHASMLLGSTTRPPFLPIKIKKRLRLHRRLPLPFPCTSDECPSPFAHHHARTHAQSQAKPSQPTSLPRPALPSNASLSHPMPLPIACFALLPKSFPSRLPSTR